MCGNEGEVKGQVCGTEGVCVRGCVRVRELQVCVKETVQQVCVYVCVCV